jgi:predicted anti-sigma-YlaC factor YlaD
MTDNPNNLTCAGFQAHLPELIASGEDVTAHPHLQECELCRALLADLETIAEAARQLFPIVEPPDELWEHIESAIRNEKDSAGSQSPDGTKAARVGPRSMSSGG